MTILISNPKKLGLLQKVRFAYTDPEAQEVFLAGSFNDWNPTTTPLTKVGSGRWVKDLALPPGRHEYQYVVDGRWIHDRAARKLVENPMGGLNAIVEVHPPTFMVISDRPATARVNPKWAWHYRALCKWRDRLLKDRQQQISEASEPVEFHRMHLADTASDELDHALAIGELAVEQNLLYEVEQAIERIRDGTYGKCQLTGKPIPAARLRAVPWTPFSKEAQGVGP